MQNVEMLVIIDLNSLRSINCSGCKILGRPVATSCGISRCSKEESDTRIARPNLKVLFRAFTQWESGW